MYQDFGRGYGLCTNLSFNCWITFLICTDHWSILLGNNLWRAFLFTSWHSFLHTCIDTKSSSSCLNVSKYALGKCHNSKCHYVAFYFWSKCIGGISHKPSTKHTIENLCKIYKKVQWVLLIRKIVDWQHNFGNDKYFNCLVLH